MEKVKLVRALIPRHVKDYIKRSMGIAALDERVTEIQIQLGKFQEILYGEDIWEKVKRRWRDSEPEKGLTWDTEISGDNFVRKLQRYVTFDKNVKVMEIGPGYGRLLKSVLAMKLDFKKYVGLDISAKNVRFLQALCPDKAVEFVHGDAENFSSSDNFDVVFSSLTFKHLFPTFEIALKNLSRCLAPGGTIVFDLLEGDKRMFENDQATYLHFYSKKAVAAILEKVPLELVAFDQVEHMPGYIRLLVVARKV